MEEQRSQPGCPAREVVLDLAWTRLLGEPAIQVLLHEAVVRQVWYVVDTRSISEYLARTSSSCGSKAPPPGKEARAAAPRGSRGCSRRTGARRRRTRHLRQ